MSHYGVRVITSQGNASQYESVSNESLRVIRECRDVRPHIPNRQYESCLRLGDAYTRDPAEPVRRDAGPSPYFLTWPLERSPECASW